MHFSTASNSILTERILAVENEHCPGKGGAVYTPPSERTIKQIIGRKFACSLSVKIHDLPEL
jgi:hypothetical protein